MSFLGWPTESQQLGKRTYQRRKVTAHGLVDQFAKAFSEIQYDLLWDTPTANAQAWRLGNVLRVTVYGGLARHPAITACGLALVLAHETGHHLGGPPLDPDLRWPTWQGQADYWAATIGMPKVFGRAASRLTLRGAKQIAALHAEFTDLEEEPDITPMERSAIFRAGALGEVAPVCLQAAFERMLKERELDFEGMQPKTNVRPRSSQIIS
jgi:hypothetical protein